ncbi:unnamed protein product [Pleuronectes platessa]|uniref:Uncharacterized protein n=1 Tax=Pleuronectes platessa TaxID=8262 RepID=A0A9N7YMX6_PLEPL|nr:unnamed protein product [Pleuronectes platessa]
MILTGVGVPYGSLEKWKLIGARQERNLPFLGSDVGIYVRDDLKSQAAKPNEQDTSAKGAPAVVSLSLRSESDEEEEEEEG